MRPGPHSAVRAAMPTRHISDPGVTLVELFAWMTESSLTRSTHHAGASAEVPRAPRFRPEAAAAGTHDAHAAACCGHANFCAARRPGADGEVCCRCDSAPRTERSITVSEVRLRAVQVDHGSGLQDRSGEWSNGLPVRVFGDNPQPGAAIHPRLPADRHGDTGLVRSAMGTAGTRREGACRAERRGTHATARRANRQAARMPPAAPRHRLPGRPSTPRSRRV